MNVDHLLEQAAASVLGEEQQAPAVDADQESALSALCWKLGVSIEYEKGLRDLITATLNKVDILGLIEAKIELISDYKLEYPQDYEPATIEQMRQEAEKLQTLHDTLAAQ